MKYNDGILQTLSDSFQNAEKRHGTTHWQSVEDKREKKEKKKRKRKKRKKREKWGKMTTIYSISFLFLSSSFPYSLLFLIFPSFLSVEETGKGKRESQEKERRGRRKEKERKESLLLSSSLALLFFTFYFPFSPFFFPLFALFSLADATDMMSYVVFQT